MSLHTTVDSLMYVAVYALFLSHQPLSAMVYSCLLCAHCHCISVCVCECVCGFLCCCLCFRELYTHTRRYARNVQFSNPTKSAPHSALSSIVVVVEPSLYSVRPTHFDRSAPVDSRDLHESARANSKRISRLGCLYLSSCNSLSVFFVICCHFGCNPQDLTINCIRKMPNESNQQKCVCLLQWLRQRLVSCCPVLGSGGR